MGNGSYSRNRDFVSLSMSVLGIKGDGSVDVGSTEAETTLYYSIAGKDIVFNGNKTSRRKGICLLLEVAARFMH